MALEPINKFSYTRDWTKPADFPTFEDDEQTVREDMQYQPNELKQFINEALVAFVNDSLIPLVNALVAGTIPADSVYTAAIQNGAVTMTKLGEDVTAAALGAPSKVNGIDPDGSGDIVLTGGDIAMSSTDPTTVAGAIGTKQTQTGLLAVENDIADADYLPFYDTSAADGRRTLWSNIVAKIRAAFKTTALPVDSGGTGAADAATARSNLGITPENIGALPLAGGTMTGKMQNNFAEGSGVEVTHADAGKDCGLTINKASSSNGGALFVGVGMGGNAGIYSSTFQKWLIETNQTGSMFIDDLPYRHIYVGTAAPSGGSDGDVYIRYS